MAGITRAAKKTGLKKPKASPKAKSGSPWSKRVLVAQGTVVGETDDEYENEHTWSNFTTTTTPVPISTITNTINIWFEKIIQKRKQIIFGFKKSKYQY